jgi:hypothetical protein
VRVPAGARQWRARGGPRVLSGRKAWGRSSRLADLSAPGPWLCRSHWAAGGSVQRGCLPGPGRGWSGRAGQLSQQDGRVGGHPGWSWYPLLGRCESPGRGMDRAAPAPAGAWRCRAGGRHGVACRYWRLGIAESVRRVPPPGRGLPARGVGRGSWCGEVLPRAPRPQVPKPPRCSPGAANRINPSPASGPLGGRGPAQLVVSPAEGRGGGAAAAEQSVSRGCRLPARGLRSVARGRSLFRRAST